MIQCSKTMMNDFILPRALDLRRCTCTSTLKSVIWLDLCWKKLCIFLLLLSTSPNINTCHKAACCVRFRILLWANLSWCSKAEGPLTPACWLSLHCLPAACCHGYFSSVAGRYSSSLMYDTASLTKHQCFCVAVIISHLLDAFCSPHHLSPGFVRAHLDQNEETDRCNWSTRTRSIAIFWKSRMHRLPVQMAVDLVPLYYMKQMPSAKNALRLWICEWSIQMYF